MRPREIFLVQGLVLFAERGSVGRFHKTVTTLWARDARAQAFQMRLALCVVVV